MKKKVFSLMMTLLLAFMGVAKAETVVIGDAGTSTSYYIPFNSLYNYSFTEVVYPASEIGTAGTINSISFYLGTANTSADQTNDIVLFMKNVSRSTFASNTDFETVTSGDIVFSGSWTIPMNYTGWVTINLDTPFAYDGTSNLMVAMDENTGDYNTRYFTYVSVTNCGIQGYSDTYNPDPYNMGSYSGSKALRSYMPKTQLDITPSGGAGAGDQIFAVQDGNIVDTVFVGPRPNGTWMEPFTFQIRNTGAAVTVTNLDWTPNTYFSLADDELLPFDLARDGEQDIALNTGDAQGNTDWQMVAIYGTGRTAAIWNINVETYDPACPDVWELACEHATTFPFVEVPATRHGVTLYDNYDLPFDEIPEGYDAVYKLVFNQDVMLNAEVTAGADGKVALYTEDFYGEGGPMAANYYQGPAAGGGAAGGPFEAQIGEGTSTTGYFPFYTLYNYSIAENLFLPAELEAAGVTSAPMTSLSWYATNAPGYAQQGITIWMANVEDVALTTTSHIVTGMTKVYTGSMTPQIGWNEFVFNEGSFAWDGHSSILIYCQRNNGSWNSTVYWEGTASMPFTCMSYLYQDSGAYDPTVANTMYTATTRPNIIMKGGGRESGNRNLAYGPVITDAAVEAGTYYLVASSTDQDFEVTINREPMPCPTVDGFAFNPIPADNEDEVEPASVTLQWSIPTYATGWRLIFGTTYHPEVGHPQTIIYPEDGSFSTELANSFTVRNLWNNTNYFWRVEFNNDGACPDGVSSPIWGFTTHLNVPQNLTAVDETVFNDETITLNWNAVVDRTYRMYFVYRDGVKIGQTQVNNIGNTTYTDGPLAYNMGGYNYYVTAVYDEGESAPSNTVNVKVSGRGDVNGHVYEQDGETGIAGATVTMVGQDEFGVSHTYNFTTNNQGYYSGAVYAGTYNGSAACNGYQTINEPVQGNPIGITYNQTTTPIDYILDENFDPVCAVIAEYYPDSLDPQSPYVKVYWGCGLPGSEIIEDFETGDFSMFDWQVDPTYPWSITTYNPYEGTYCMKSGGAGVANVVSNMTVTVEIPADGLMSFFGKISCENSWDYGYFYIDGVQKGSFTGAGNWIEKTYDITEGTHTFQWRYTKDSSVNSNDDCFYVDYINFYKQPEPPVPGMTYDFEDGTMQGWTSVDADGDGYGWYMGSEIMTGQTGNNGSQDFVLSQSYYLGTVLYPDNYLVSPQVALGGIVRFYACAQDASYAAEHFGLAVSTTNTNPSSFTMIQEWTMTAKGAGSIVKKDGAADVNMTGASRDGNTRAQGTWYEYTVDLSAYMGQTGYVAIRHFNCSDMFYLNVDDITIGEPGAKSGENTRRFSHYRVYRTDCYNDGPYTLYDPAAGEFGNTVVLSCELHDTIYIDVSWPDAAPGVYKWGVGCVYVGNRGEEYETPISWAAPVVHRSFTTSEAAQKGPKADVEVAEQPQDRDRAYLQYSTETFSGGVGTGGGAVYWGIRFPAADLAAYAGQTLTKVGVFTDVDGDYGWTYSGDYTAMVYQGGATAPGTLVSTATEYLPGDLAWHDITLTTPVTIDATQDLWLCFYTPDIAYPMSGCNYVGNANSDFLSLDGTTWEHATSYNLDYTWMIRGFAEAGGGGGGGGGATIGLQEPRESEIVWSNCLDKDMYLAEGDVTVNVLLNSADSPEGIRVAFTNYNEAEQEMYPVEDVILDETGFYAYETFRKGDYKVTVTFDGYETIEEDVSIWDPTDLRYVMIEILYGIDNLYVSRTGWAMWDDSHNNPGGGGGGGGTGASTFSEDFEGGLNNWTLVDADGDGHNWYHSSQSMTYACYDYTGWGHNESDGFAVSSSYTDCTYDSYDPNNFMITNQKYSIVAGSTLNFWADYGNDSYPDHFGVAVATADNPTPADFTIVWEGNAKDANNGKSQIRHNGDRYFNWRSHSVDLSAYAGQDVYIAFRHFNSYDEYEIYIDDVELTTGAKAEANERHLEYYKVMCTSIDGEPIFNANTIHPFCQVATDALVEGDHYICKVASMYSTGMSEWEEVEWEYEPCEHWTPIEGLEVTPENEGNHLTWEFAGGGGGGGGGQGTTFNVSFEGGLPAGWSVVDANNDGYTWCLTSAIPSTWTYYASLTLDWYRTGTDAICSGSYINGVGALNPNEYLITDQVTIANGSTFSFWAAATDATYAADHFGVFVSTTGTNPNDFTMVNEWTLTGKGGNKAGDLRASRDGNGMRLGSWHNFSVDLSAYAGQQVYIAIRHFNCTDQYIMCVDDVELTNGAKGTRDEVAFNGYVTDPGAMANGADASWTKNGQSTWGPNANYAAGTGTYYWLADSFTLSAATTISEIEVYGYQTGSSTNSTFTGLYAQIYNGSPMSGGTAVWGDVNTNIMTATAFTNCYRGSDGETTATTRPIMSITASGLNIDLEAGTYYLVYALTGSGSSGPWGAPHAEPSVGNTGNGLQKTSSGWTTLSDSGSGTPYGCAMKITGNGGGVTPTPVDGVLGFMVFRDGEWLAEILDPNARDYTDIDELDEHEYCVRVIYDGTAVLPSNNYYYAMSCPGCEGIAALCAAGGDIDITYNSMTDEVTVFWTGDTRSNLVKYNVYRSSDKVTYEMIGSVASVEGRTYYEYVDAPEAGHYFYQVRAEYSNGCESEPALRLNAHEYNYVEMEVTGVDENDGMAIFPNPTKGNVTIQAAGMQHITVVSVLGQVVYDADIDADEVILNMSQYTAGMYTVRVTTENGIRVERITVIR